METINVQIKENKYVSPNEILLGNQYESGQLKIIFTLPDSISEYNKYVYLKNRKYGKFYIYPLNEIGFIISQNVSYYDGVWDFYILADKNNIIENYKTEPTFSNFVFVSNLLIGRIKKVNFSIEDAPDEMDINLKLLYEDLLELKKELENMPKIKELYPVGSIYISTENVNPNVYFPNTVWETFGTGKTLVSVDANNELFNAPKKTGGEIEKTLNVEISGDKNTAPIVLETSEKEIYYVDNNSLEIKYNTLQPYITVYMWERVE